MALSSAAAAGFTGLPDGAGGLPAAGSAAAFPPAPAQPQGTEVIVASHRGGSGDAPPQPSAWPAPATLAGYMMSASPPAGLLPMIALLGAEGETEMDEFCMIPEVDLANALDLVRLDDAPLAALRRGRLIKYLRQLFTDMGYVPPGWLQPGKNHHHHRQLSKQRVRPLCPRRWHHQLGRPRLHQPTSCEQCGFVRRS